MSDIDRLCDQDLVNGESPDVHTQDGDSRFLGFRRRGGQAHTPGLPASSGMDLGLDHNGFAQFTGNKARSFRRGRCFSSGRGDIERLKDFLGLILMQKHLLPPAQ